MKSEKFNSIDFRLVPNEHLYEVKDLCRKILESSKQYKRYTDSDFAFLSLYLGGILTLVAYAGYFGGKLEAINDIERFFGVFGWGVAHLSPLYLLWFYFKRKKVEKVYFGYTLRLRNLGYELDAFESCGKTEVELVPTKNLIVKDKT